MTSHRRPSRNTGKGTATDVASDCISFAFLPQPATDRQQVNCNRVGVRFRSTTDRIVHISVSGMVFENILEGGRKEVLPTHDFSQLSRHDGAEPVTSASQWRVNVDVKAFLFRTSVEATVAAASSAARQQGRHQQYRHERLGQRESEAHSFCRARTKRLNGRRELCR